MGGWHLFLDWIGIVEILKASFSTPVATLLHILLYVLWFAFWARFVFYLNELRGADNPPGDFRRKRFDALRGRLESCPVDSDSYARLVEKFVDWIDHFFDGPPEKRADRAPLWTASSYDRCLMLALIYPLICVFVVWAISGETGPVEEALRFSAVSVPKRSLLLVLVASTGLAFYFALTSEKIFAWVVFSASIIAVFIVTKFVGHGSVLNPFTGSVALFGAVAFSGAVALSGGIAITSISHIVSVGALFVASVSVINAAFLVCSPYSSDVANFPIRLAVSISVSIAIYYIDRLMYARGKRTFFLIASSILTVAACVVGAWTLPQFSGWRDGGPLLLFFGLLTMVNAPFDWTSLGLTRFLLRRGLDRGGVWPYFYAVVDAVAGSMLITVLAVALTVAIDGFNSVAVLRGGDAARILPPMRDYLAALRVNPSAYEYWWLYVTILTTLLPSVINLFLAGFAFLRGNFLNRQLLALMPEGRAVPAPYSFVVAFVLTIQGALAVCFAFAAQFGLGWLILHELMPMFQAGPLQAAEAFAF